ncbi:MFS transporter [Pseudomonas daroniae]|uniref:MFS transporter n=1 Tax=Phytopseudomonas daroniae TaxID=2487519 RepID=A0A4Q9QIA8_9GAMM|nr:MULTISPECIES: MFS transporter [Pseudomonas]TBU75703.1 MFS transporter [Pseudomonas daroniae]TBU80498.1 MFS transporter [Pseudomonas sp. FRB 228]TBU89677.1 MFS transporter [Pseudomonas daroniae]
MYTDEHSLAAAQVASGRERLPLNGLLVLAGAGFITILTEALPAGLLPQLSADLGVSQAMVGQMVTLYALGSLLAAIPLVMLTRNWRRRPLLLTAIGGFAVVNLVTALSSHYPLTLVARFFAGVFAGLLWALVAGYAARMVASHLQGRAIAVAMVGTPLALSLGIPAGTFLGGVLGWRYTFVLMSVLTLVLLVWGRIVLPDFAGQRSTGPLPVGRVFRLPGVRPVLFTILIYVLAHNLFYTYIAAFLSPLGMVAEVDRVLLAFGLSALVGIWLTGMLIDRWLRVLSLLSAAVLALACVMLAMSGSSALLVYAGVAAWGLAFGGVATLFQTASIRAAGDDADVAQSMCVTAWNLGIAGGGLCGGILLQSVGGAALPWGGAGLALLAWLIVYKAGEHGFTRGR